MTLSFFYLLIAAVFQLAWLYNMKRIKKGIWTEIKQGPLFSIKNLKAVFPLVLYLIFGISNVVFLTWSMQNIAPSIAYAIWTGIVIGAATMIDQMVSKKPLKPIKILFLLFILAGILGLRLNTP